MDIQEISLVVTVVLFIVEIFILIFSNIETTKRRFFLVLDFIAIFILFFLGILIILWLVIPILIIPVVVAFFFLYNLVLFKIVKRFILKARLARMKEEVNDALIDSLKALSDLDVRGAYEILEDALKRHPDSRPLLNLKSVLDKRMKKADVSEDPKRVDNKDVKQINE